MTEVWTDKSEPLFSNVKEGVIIFKPRSAKGLLQFTEEVIITQRQTRTLTWVFQYCQSKFSDLASAFVTDVWPHFFMHQQNVLHLLMWSSRESWAWSFFRVSTYVSELMEVPCGMTFTSKIPSTLRKTTAITFPAEDGVLNFPFLGKFAWCHSTDCFLICGSKWCSQVSSPITILARKSSLPIPYCSKM